MEEGILVEYSYFLNISKNRVYDISGAGNGIFLNSSFFNNITDNKIYENVNGNGIKLENSSFNKVSENIVYNNEVGIALQESHNNTISRNNVSINADNGLVLGQSHNNSILENNINDNTQDGIYMINSHNNTISKNEIKDNTMDGIYVSNSNDNIIFGNNIQNNDDGIKLYVSDYNTLYENSIDTNNNRGIFADDGNGGSHYNLAYWNFFTGNVIHAIDKTSTNYWNNSFIGNYWNNYTGTDLNNDGIGETAHSFNGGIDYLPIWDILSPIISIITPTEGEVFGGTAPSFTIEINEPYLDLMWYSLDGGFTNNAFIANGSINQSAWDLLPQGVVNITFSANDIFGQIGSASVLITKRFQTGGDGSVFLITGIIISVVGSVAIIAAASIIYLKKRRMP
jgi:parallel beta-helix repeat protein